MSCYLCAYQSATLPEKGRPLPPGSPAKSNDDLGTCSICAVWACSRHGTRYAQFECGICTPATATKQVIIAGALPTGSGGAAATQAYLVGQQASLDQRRRMSAGLQRIRQDHQSSRQLRMERRLVVPPDAGEANLVANLARVIRQNADVREGFVPMARTAAGEFGAISIDAVSAVVRNTFAGTEIVEPSDLVVITATGALLLALSLANEPVARRRAGAPNDWVASAEMSPPWNVSHPGLLDPVIWLIGTAYQVARVT